MRAAGAHVSTYHGPLQQLVMCACHRTSPTATLLTCDGLYASTAAEQRGLNISKLMSFRACHCASGATAARSTARRRVHRRSSELSRSGAGVRLRAAFAPRKTKPLPSAPKPVTLELGTTQRRLPPADKKNAYAAAAPRKRRVFTASEGVCADAPALFRIRPHNAAVQRPRDQVSSAARVHNEMTHMRRARDDVSRSAATAC